MEKRDLLLMCLETCSYGSVRCRDIYLTFLNSLECVRLNDVCFIACLVHTQRRFSLKKTGSEFYHCGKTSFTIDVFGNLSL